VNLRNTDGTGWLPVSLASVPGLNPPLPSLPIDPTNDGTHYYAYSLRSAAGSYSLAAIPESNKYEEVAAEDGGNSTTYFETAPAEFATPSTPVQQGPNSPGTTADDASVGTVAWTNTANARVSDNAYAEGNNVMTVFNIKDNRVRIIRSNGTIGSTDKAIGSAWPGTDGYASYGGAADLWGEAWTPADINSSNFGVAVSATDESFFGPVESHYLKASNFGFSIPAGSTINGIQVDMERKERDNLSGYYYADIDHIRITVHYTAP
jgi:hypothetical protein